MKKKKNQIFSGLSLVLIIGLAACGGNEKAAPAAAQAGTHVADSTEIPKELGEFNREWTGTVAKQKVHLMLRRNGDSLHGEYSYHSVSNHLWLNGKLDPVTNRFKLDEKTPDGKLCGSWEGIIRNDFTLEGEWCNQGRKGGCHPFEAKTKGDNNFIWYKPGFPFHPRHVALAAQMGDSKKKVDIRKQPDMKGITLYKDKDIKDVVGFEEAFDDFTFRQAYFEYRYLGMYKGDYLVSVNESGGGTGIFSSIERLRLKNGILTVVESYGGGDRCNNGVGEAVFRGKTLEYEEYITFADLVFISKVGQNAGQDAELDLMSCAVCCAATAHFVYHFDKKPPTLDHILLEDLGEEEEVENPYEDMHRLTELLRDFMRKNGNRMSPAQLNELVSKLLNGKPN